MTAQCMVQPRQASIPGTAGPGDGVVMIESPSGSHEWYRGDKRHRENGPALEWADGSREWFRDGRGIVRTGLRLSGLTVAANGG